MKFLISFYQSIKHREGLKKVLKNSLWLFYDRFFRLGFSLIVGAMLARYLAPGLYGTFNYALSFVALFSILGSLGLDNILVREILKSPDKENVLLGSAFILKLVGGFLIIILSAAVIVLTKPNDPLSLYLVLIFAVWYALQSINIIDLYFQSRIKSKYTVISNNIAFIISSALKIICIFLKASVIIFAWLYIAEAVISLFGLLLFYHRLGYKIKLWRFNQKIAFNLLKDSWPLILSGAAIMVYMRIDQVMIGNMLGNVDVGLYSAAVKISEVWYFIPMAIISSVYPKIVEAKNFGESMYHLRMQQLFNIVAIFGYIVAIAATFFANDIIYFIFGKAYIFAANILIVHIWCGLFIGLGSARTSWLICENNTVFQMVSTFLGAIVNVILNLSFIRKYGAVGAAYATLISQIIVCYFATVLVSWKIFKMQTKALLFVWRF